MNVGGRTGKRTSILRYNRIVDHKCLQDLAVELIVKRSDTKQLPYLRLMFHRESQTDVDPVGEYRQASPPDAEFAEHDHMKPTELFDRYAPRTQLIHLT